MMSIIIIISSAHLPVTATLDNLSPIIHLKPIPPAKNISSSTHLPIHLFIHLSVHPSISIVFLPSSHIFPLAFILHSSKSQPGPLLTSSLPHFTQMSQSARLHSGQPNSLSSSSPISSIFATHNIALLSIGICWHCIFQLPIQSFIFLNSTCKPMPFPLIISSGNSILHRRIMIYPHWPYFVSYIASPSSLSRLLWQLFSLSLGLLCAQALLISFFLWPPPLLIISNRSIVLKAISPNKDINVARMPAPRL